MTVLFENVLFLSGASGATTKRTPAQRWADVFNVKDFGAKGDGSTDDTTAIQNAINAAMTTGVNSLGGAIVFFPPGQYKVTASLVDTAAPGGTNIQLIGSGRTNTNI